MNEELMKINIELRSLSEKIKEGTVTAAEAEKKLNELKQQKREIEQKIAQANVPIDTESRTFFADVSKAMMEKRDIVLNSTGSILQIKELVKELSQKKEILNHVKYFVGANASTSIPVFSPSLATPGAYAEGTIALTNDTQATLSSKTLTPFAFVSVLPVSAEALTLGTVNLENEFNSIFTDAFSDGFCKQVCTGSGSSMQFKGLFTDITETVTCAASGMPKISDLVALSLKMRDKADNSVIVMNPFIYSGILSSATTDSAKIYAEEMIRNKTIEGTKIILTGYAPNSITAGSTVCVAYRASDYGFALSGEIRISKVEAINSTNTYFKAMVFANGTKIIDKNFYGLVTA